MRTSLVGMNCLRKLSVGSGKFGWCLTERHDQCPLITSTDYCKCECHNKEVVNG